MESTLARLIKVLEFDFGQWQDLLDRMTSLEVAVEAFEKTADSILRDNTRSAIMIQKAFKNHILLVVPTEEIRWIMTKKAAPDCLLAQQSMARGLAPMDVSAVRCD